MEIDTQHHAIIAIQARLHSVRSPGKILRDFGGMAMLGFQMRRLTTHQSCPVVALVPEADAATIKAALPEQCCVYASPCEENDVLGRYAEFARTMLMGPDDTILRVTGDCPLLCPFQIRYVLRMWESWQQTAPPLAYYGMGPGWPDGLADIDVIRVRALLDADTHCTDPVDREHLAYFWKQTARYPQATCPFPAQWQAQPWPKFSVDTDADFAYVTRVMQLMATHWGYHDTWPIGFSWEDVLTLVRRKPELQRTGEAFNAGYLAQIANSAASWGDVRYGGLVA